MKELIDRETTVKQICKMGEMLGIGHDRNVTIAVALFVQDDKSAFPTIELPQWIPVTYRQMDDDEYCNFCKEYGEIPVEERKVFDCQMPEDGQEILISTKYEHIFLDTCVYDDGYGLEEYGDWEDVIAWMPLPTPYMKEGEAE